MYRSEKRKVREKKREKKREKIEIEISINKKIMTETRRRKISLGQWTSCTVYIPTYLCVRVILLDIRREEFHINESPHRGFI